MNNTVRAITIVDIKKKIPIFSFLNNKNPRNGTAVCPEKNSEFLKSKDINHEGPENNNASAGVVKCVRDTKKLLINTKNENCAIATCSIFTLKNKGYAKNAITIKENP